MKMQDSCVSVIKDHILGIDLIHFSFLFDAYIMGDGKKTKKNSHKDERRENTEKREKQIHALLFRSRASWATALKCRV